MPYHHIKQTPSLAAGAVKLTWNPQQATNIGNVQLESIVNTDHASQLYENDNKVIKFYTDPLTREEINLLIRALRRARDAAYGKDS